MRFFKRGNKRTKKVWVYFNKGAFWASPIAMFIEAYSTLSMSVLISILKPTFESPGQQIQMYLSYYFAFLVFVGPFFLAWFMWTNFDRFSNEVWLEQYEPLVEHLDVNMKSIITHRFFFFIRRLLLAFSLILTSTLIYQIFFFFLQEVITIIVIGMGEPFDEKADYFKEMINEQIIMICMYHFMLFTPFVPEIWARAYVGYSLTGILVSYLFTNLTKVAILNIKGAIKWCSRRNLHK